MNNLFKCPDCGNDVSRSVKVCPHCGNNKIQKQLRSKEWEEMDPTKKKKIMYGVGIFLLVYTSQSFRHLKDFLSRYFDYKACPLSCP